MKCYQFNFGQWPQAAAQVQIWDVLEEAQGDFALDHVWQIVWFFYAFSMLFSSHKVEVHLAKGLLESFKNKSA